MSLTSTNIFNYAQPFVVDPSSVKNSTEVGVTSIALYFRAIPKERDNKSGIVAPGVEVSIIPCRNGVPAISSSYSEDETKIARMEYGEIQPSIDASIPTTFVFEDPIKITTDIEYAILVKYDGNEDFVLWNNTKGDRLITANNQTSPGVTNPSIGPLYSYIGPLSLTSANGTSSTGSVSTAATSATVSTEENQDEEYFLSNWSPMTGTSLKFDVYIARFAHSGSPVVGNTEILNDPTISGFFSNKTLNSNVTINADGTITLVSQCSRDEYVIYDQKNSFVDKYSLGEAVYQVNPYYPNNSSPLTVSVVARATTALDDYVTASNSAFNANGGFTNIFGQSDEEYIVIVSGNTVNVRRVVSIESNTVIKLDGDPVTITNAGAYFYKSSVGFIGGIKDTMLFNSIEPMLILYDSNANGSVRFSNTNTLKSEINGNIFANVIIRDIQTARISPSVEVNNPLGTTYSITHRSLFYNKNGTTYINPTPENTDTVIKNYESSAISDISKSIVMPSRSNQFILTYEANSSTANSSVLGEHASNASVLLFTVSSNNDFSAPFFDPTSISTFFYSYTINNDYTNEHTNYGNALSKDITTKVSFEDHMAEDALVYLTAYRPAGTDLKVYLRIHNSADPEAFDDKDWTLLECINNQDVYSSQTDESDMVEYTYNFYSYPQNTYSLSGTATLSLNSATVVGSGTTFFSNLAAQDVVRIYSPLFGDNQVVGVIDNIISNTSIVLTTPISNSSLVGSGFKVEKMNYPMQAFNNILNSNTVKYFNNSRSEFDGYDSAQVKVVYLSNSTSVVPKVDDISLTGTSP